MNPSPSRSHAGRSSRSASRASHEYWLCSETNASLASARHPLERLGTVVRRAEGADLPLAHERVEGLDGLLERRRGIFLVMLVEIDHVGLKALQGCIERAPDVVRRPAVLGAVAHRLAPLARENDPVAPSLQHSPEERLAAAVVAVDVGGVEERDARVERSVDDAPRRLFFEATAEVVAAEADDAHLERPE